MKINVEEVLDQVRNMDEDDLRRVRNLSTRVLYGRHRQVSTNIIETVSAEAKELATVLDELVRANYKFLKRINVNVSAVDINKLNRIDKRSFVEIKEIITWSQKDDFWKQNVRSGGSLRRHFDKLLVKYHSTKPEMSSSVSYVAQNQAKPLSRAVVDPNSPGYKKFKEERNKLADKKSVK